jgi:hypothetical protein
MVSSQTSSEPSVARSPTPLSTNLTPNWAAVLAPQNTYIAPDQVTHAHRTYIKRLRPPPTARGRESSRIWDHGVYYIAEVEGRPSYEAWACSICGKFMPLSDGGTGHQNKHLKKHEDTTRAYNGGPAPPSSLPERPSALSSHSSLIHSLNIVCWRAKLLKWVVISHTPFRVVEDMAFREMLMELHPQISRYIPVGTTLRRWLQKEFQQATGIIRSWLRGARSRIHLSFDLWTSPNRYAMLGVIGHFVHPSEPRNQHVLLALRRMSVAHTGEEIAKVLLEAISYWEIPADDLGVFVSDNATVNDVAIKLVLGKLQLLYEDTNQRRGRCIGHILNLAAKAFLFGQDVEAFESAVDVGDNEPETSFNLQRAQQEWRNKGPVGKLHNLVVYIRASPGRGEAFRLISTGNHEVDSTYNPI